jgi:hypothetical protein
VHPGWGGHWEKVCDLDWIHSTQGCPLCDALNQAIINHRGSLRDRYKPALVSRGGKDYFRLGSIYTMDYVVLGVALSEERLRYDWNNPQVLLLPTNARRSFAQSVPKGRLISNPINWGILKQWLSDCNEQHSTNCVTEGKLAVAGMRFIDCETLEIVPSPKTPPPYIALSYLWGRAGNPTEGPLLGGMPLVVEDTIQVVKELGFRYLWVDRYCITQDGGQEMHTLLSNMDKIYSCAAFTVIANGEANTCYGLPGVNSISRAPQPIIQIGSEEYTLCWVNTRDTVEHSEWSARGWTFQEALLSKRKLVFTENQVYFQCREMFCLETLEMPVPFGHYSSRPLYLRGIVFRETPPDSPESSFTYRIAEYWPRKLAHKSDRYKAFQGILHSYSQMNMPLQNIYGIPIFKSFASQSMAEALQSGLCWRSKNDLSRNLTFPSWTWFGWEVNTEFHDRQYSFYGTTDSAPLDSLSFTFLCKSISVVFDASTSMDLNERFDDILERSLLKGPPPCLTMSCIIFDINLSVDETLGKFKVYPLPQGCTDIRTELNHSKAGRSESFRQCFGLLIIADKDLFGDGYDLHVLYLSLKDLPSLTYERIGYGQLCISKAIKDGLVRSPTSIVGSNNFRRQTIRLE